MVLVVLVSVLVVVVALPLLLGLGGVVALGVPFPGVIGAAVGTMPVVAAAAHANVVVGAKV